MFGELVWEGSLVDAKVARRILWMLLLSNPPLFHSCSILLPAPVLPTLL